MAGRVGLTPVPDDEELIQFLTGMIAADADLCDHHIIELRETIEETLKSEEPIEFAYARMINFLAEGIEVRELAHLCAAAMWRLHGQNNAEITSISGETDAEAKENGR